MTITLDDAKTQLNKALDVHTDDAELTFYVNAANEWINARAIEPTSYTAQLAARMLVAHWWDTQRGPIGSPLDDDSGSNTPRGSWFSIPNKVKELLPELDDEAVTPKYSFPDPGAWPDQVAT